MITYRTRLIEKLTHGRAVSHLLKTDGKVIKPPDVITCFGSFKMNTYPLFDGSQGGDDNPRQPLRHFTYSRNGGPIQRVVIDHNSDDWDAIDALYVKLDTDLCRAQDGKSLAFYMNTAFEGLAEPVLPEVNDYHSFPSDPTPVPATTRQLSQLDYTYCITGLNGEGLVADDSAIVKDARNIAIPHPAAEVISDLGDLYEYPRWYPTNTILTEDNMLTIYPSDNVGERDFDLYQVLGGEAGTPIVIASCVKAVPGEISCVGTYVVGAQVGSLMPSRLAVRMDEESREPMTAFNDPFPLSASSEYTDGTREWPIDDVEWWSRGTDWIASYRRGNGPLKVLTWNTGTRDGTHHGVWDAIKELLLDDYGRTAFMLSTFNITDRHSLGHLVKTGISSNATFVKYAPWSDEVNPGDYTGQYRYSGATVEVRDGTIRFTNKNEGVIWEENTITIYPTPYQVANEYGFDGYSDYYEYLCQYVDQSEVGEPIVIHSCAVVEPTDHIQVNTKLIFKNVDGGEVPARMVGLGLSAAIKLNDGVVKHFKFEPAEYQDGLFDILNYVYFLGKTPELTVPNGDGITTELKINQLYFRMDFAKQVPELSGCSGNERSEEIWLPIQNPGNFVDPWDAPNIEVIEGPDPYVRESNKVTFIKNPINGYTDLFELIKYTEGNEHTIYSSAVVPSVIWDKIDDGEEPVDPEPDGDLSGIEPFTFTNVSKPGTTGITKFDIGMSDTVGYWEIRESGQLIASPNYRGDGVGFDSNRDDYKSIVIYNMNGVTRNFEVYVRASTVSVGIGSLNTIPGEVELKVTSCGNVSPKMIFRVGNGIVYLPETFPPHITDCEGMFNNGHNIGSDITGWDMSNVTNMAFMFADCRAFNQDISGWNVSNVTQMNSMFWGAYTFNQDLSKWCVSNILSYPNGFASEANAWTLPKPVWGTCPGTDIPVYDDTGAFKFTINGPIGTSELRIEMYDPNPDWVLLRDGVVVGGGLQGDLLGITFANTDKTTSEYTLIGSDFVTSLNVNSWTTVVNSVEVTQFPTKAVAVRFGLEDIPFTVPTTLPKNITTLGSMFAGCTAFNQDISMWDTAHVTEMYGVFTGCTTFNQPLNTWNVSGAAELRNMFEGCKAFNQPLNNWDVSSVTNMDEMFKGATLFNQPLSNWNVTNVTNMNSMFSYASAFNQDLSKWCVTEIPTKPYQFDERASAWVLPKPIWGTCPGGAVEVNTFAFTTTNRLASTPLPVALRVVSSGAAWSLIDADTQVVIHESLEGEVVSGDEVTVYLEDEGVGAERRYVINGDATEVNLVIEDEGASEGFVKVESFSTTINQYKYDVKNADITVPLLLPKNVTNADSMFENCYNFNTDITGWDTSAITSMNSMFYMCSKFNQDLSGWDVSKVTDMSYMFTECVEFNGDISTWVTSSLTNLYMTFTGCSSFNQNLNNWDVSQVTDFSDLFSGCSVFNSPLNKWNMTKAEYINGCFSGATVFNQNINDWSLPLVTNLDYIFNGAEAFNQPLDKWVIPELYSLQSTFMNASSFNQDISTWNVSLVNSMDATFESATSFNKPLNAWDTQSLTSANNMFFKATSFNQPLSNWNTSSAYTMDGMFSDAKAFNQDLSSWCVSQIYNQPHNFSSGCLNWAESQPIWGTCDDVTAKTFNFELTTGPVVASDSRVRLIVSALMGGWELYRDGVIVSSRSVTDPRVDAVGVVDGDAVTLQIVPAPDTIETYVLKVTTGTLEVGYIGEDGSNHQLDVTQFSSGVGSYLFNVYGLALTVPTELPTYVRTLTDFFKGSTNFNQDISTWNVSHIEDFSRCFSNCKIFNSPLNTWDMSNASQLDQMFKGAKAFNQPLDGWMFYNVSVLQGMFDGASSFNQDISTWDVSWVWNYSKMFCNASAFNKPLNAWDVSYANDMTQMFYGAVAFNQPLDTWDTGTVSNMTYMFSNTTAFNQDISTWNVSAVSDMTYMFDNARGFNQDISTWNVLNIPSKPYSFDTNTPQWLKAKPIWGTDGVVIPPPGPIVIDPNDFNLVIDYVDAGNPTPINVEMVASNNSTYWEVWCDGEQVVGGGANGSADGTIKLVGRKLTITNRTKRTQLAVKGYMTSISTTVFSESNEKNITVDASTFCVNIGAHKFTTRDCALSVPSVLPRNITTLVDMFKMCYNIVTDISGWDVSRVSNMDWMFWLATGFNQDLSGWDVTLIPSEPDNFADGTDAWVLPKPIWGTNAGVGVEPPTAEIPEYVPFEFNLTSQINASIQLESSGATPEWLVYMDDVLITDELNFAYHAITNIKVGTTNFKVYANGDSIKLSELTADADTTIDVLSFCEMVPRTLFSIQSFNFNVPSTLPANHTDLSRMFYGCSAFNQNLSGWDTSQVTMMEGLFYEASAFNGDITTWNTSRVTTMTRMFSGAHQFNQDISTWDLGACVYANELFDAALIFNKPIGTWNVSNVIDMSSMFKNAQQFDQDISGWNVANVGYMDQMFFVAKVFNQDLSGWNVVNIPDEPSYFAGSADAWTLPKPNWGTTGTSGV